MYNRPGLQRQNTLEQLQANQQKSNAGGGVCALGLAIPCIIIAAEYDAKDSPCEDGSYYIIDLQTFLYVCGIMGCVYVCIAFVGYFLGEKVMRLTNGVGACIGLFYLGIPSIIYMSVYN